MSTGILRSASESAEGSELKLVCTSSGFGSAKENRGLHCGEAQEDDDR
jgi:hypothetical protein